MAKCSAFRLRWELRVQAIHARPGMQLVGSLGERGKVRGEGEGERGRGEGKRRGGGEREQGRRREGRGIKMRERGEGGGEREREGNEVSFVTSPRVSRLWLSSS